MPSADLGRPADAATAAAVTATMRQLIACGNAGEGLRVPALYTDRLLARVFIPAGGSVTWDPPDVAELEATPATPRPKAQRLPLPTLRDVRILLDGRVSAFVEIVPEPGTEDVFTSFLVFAEEGGRYLIDEIVEDVGFETPTS